MKTNFLKNPLIIGGVLQLLLLFEMHSLLDGGRHFRFFYPLLVFWDVIWLAGILLSTLFSNSKSFRTFWRSILMAITGPVIIYIIANIACPEFKIAYARDSIENVTTNTWVLDVAFVSGEHHSFDLVPETVTRYIATKKNGNPPLLTNIVVQLKNSRTNNYILSVTEISKLRQASSGELKLILYADGIACMPPTLKHANFQTLRDKKSEVLKWTMGALGNQ